MIVFGLGLETSGIPTSWAATRKRAGVNLVRNPAKTARDIQARLRGLKQPGDIVVASIHWGGNWGYEVPREERDLAHGLIDDAGVDVVHGHSSHHVKGIEVYHGKPVLYGCGDFINDYEGIGGFEWFRGDLSLMYFAEMEPQSERLVALRMKPMRMRRFRVNRASRAEAAWLGDTLNREGKRFGMRVEIEEEDTLVLRWG